MPSSTTQVQWLKLPAWKVGDREFVPRSGSFKEIKCCAYLEEPPGPRGSVSKGQYNLIHLTILRRQFNLYVARDLAKLKKSKYPRKTLKWVSESSPNANFCVFFGTCFQKERIGGG